MKKNIIYIILCAFSLGLFSCGTDEPKAKTIEEELCGTWKSVGTLQIYDEDGDMISGETIFDSTIDYLILEVQPSVIYVVQYHYNKNYDEYESTRYALTNWYYFGGYIRGTYTEYDGTHWVSTNSDIDYWKIKVLSKDKAKLCIKINSEFDNRVLYVEYPFTKISNDYNY